MKVTDQMIKEHARAMIVAEGRGLDRTEQTRAGLDAVLKMKDVRATIVQEESK